MKIKKGIKLAVLGTTIALGISSCSTMGNVMSHKDLKVESKMSDSLFLDPVRQENKVVFISVKNTTSSDVDNLKQDISKRLEANGWKVTDNIDKAFYMIQVNILQAGEVKDPNEALSTVKDGFGSVIGGGMAGVATGLVTNNYRTAGIVGVGTGAADFVGSQLTKDKAYSVITDVQISQKVDGKVTQVTNADLSNGRAGATNQSYTDSSNWVHHRVRVGTVADQMNLTLEKALPTIEQQLAKQISGILA